MTTTSKHNRTMITRGLAEVKTPRDLRVASSMLREGADAAERLGEHGWAEALRKAYGIAQLRVTTNVQVRKAIEVINRTLSEPTRDDIQAAYVAKGHDILWCGQSFECYRCGCSGALGSATTSAPGCLPH